MRFGTPGIQNDSVCVDRLQLSGLPCLSYWPGSCGYLSLQAPPWNPMPSHLNHTFQKERTFMYIVSPKPLSNLVTQAGPSLCPPLISEEAQTSSLISQGYPGS